MAYTGERHALYLASSHPDTHMCTRWSLSLCAGEMYEIALEVLPVDRNDRPWPVVRTRTRRTYRVGSSAVQVFARKMVSCVRLWARVRGADTTLPCAAVHLHACVR